MPLLGILANLIIHLHKKEKKKKINAKISGVLLEVGILSVLFKEIIRTF